MEFAVLSFSKNMKLLVRLRILSGKECLDLGTEFQDQDRYEKLTADCQWEVFLPSHRHQRNSSTSACLECISAWIIWLKHLASFSPHMISLSERNLVPLCICMQGPPSIIITIYDNTCDAGMCLAEDLGGVFHHLRTGLKNKMNVVT